MNLNRLLRLEGVAVFLGATTAYFLLDGSLWFYLPLFLVPNLGMLGYFVGPLIGSRTYNIAHTYVPQLTLCEPSQRTDGFSTHSIGTETRPKCLASLGEGTNTDEVEANFDSLNEL